MTVCSLYKDEIISLLHSSLSKKRINQLIVAGPFISLDALVNDGPDICNRSNASHLDSLLVIKNSDWKKKQARRASSVQ